jgi:hypothetical protein
VKGTAPELKTALMRHPSEKTSELLEHLFSIKTSGAIIRILIAKIAKCGNVIL